MIKVADGWDDFEILGTGDGEKLERWGDVFLLRPDPQVIWKAEEKLSSFGKLHAKYCREGGGGMWIEKRKMPAEWVVSRGVLKFTIKPMGFKHTGLFPEQAVNWDFATKMIKEAKRPISVLNLFAYTGGATVACLAAGASVTHVDASKGMVERAKQNAKISGLEKASARFLIDDCKKFVEKEIRRGKTYDAIIMDPPSFGRGPTGEEWKIEKHLIDFVKLTKQVLSKNPLFVLINSYTTGLQPTVIKNILSIVFGNENTEAFEIALPTKNENILLPCGCTGIKTWKTKKEN